MATLKGGLSLDSIGILEPLEAKVDRELMQRFAEAEALYRLRLQQQIEEEDELVALGIL